MFEVAVGCVMLNFAIVSFNKLIISYLSDCAVDEPDVAAVYVF